jgi:hypothetical protein
VWYKVLLANHYTPRKHSLGGVYRNRPVCPSVRTNFHIFCPIATKLCEIMMCELCSIKDFIVHCALPLLCLFGIRNFETIQYALCHRKFSYMINQKFMKLCTLQDPNMKMCTLVVYPGPSSFPRIMSLKVVFQIRFGSIKMMGMRGVLVPRSGVKLFHLCINAGLLRPAVPLVTFSNDPVGSPSGYFSPEIL